MKGLFKEPTIVNTESRSPCRSAAELLEHDNNVEKHNTDSSTNDNCKKEYHSMTRIETLLTLPCSNCGGKDEAIQHQQEQAKQHSLHPILRGPASLFQNVVGSVDRNVKKWKREALKRRLDSNLRMLQEVKRNSFAITPEEMQRERASVRRRMGGDAGVAALFSPINVSDIVCIAEKREKLLSVGAPDQQSLSSYTGSDTDETVPDESELLEINLLPDSHESIPKLLNNLETMRKLQEAMPLTLHYRSWTRLYSLVRDGDSFGTFLRRVRGWKHTLVVVETTANELVGGFADSAWDQGCLSVDGIFFGTGQSYLFSVQRQGDNDEEDLEIFPWRGTNQYMQLCRSSDGCIAMGGGGDDGTFGFCVQHDFTRGTSGPCVTYGNERSLTKSQHFDIVSLEVYGFVQTL